MVRKLLHTVLLFLFPSMTVIGQVLDTDTLCYKNNTVYQELIIKRINKKRIYFALSSIEKGEQVDVHKGYASISDYAYISSETDFYRRMVHCIQSLNIGMKTRIFLCR